MPSSRLILGPMLRFAMVVAVIGIAQPAFAHTLSVTRGTAVIEGSVLTVKLEPNKHGASALTRLSVCDAQGERLAGIHGSTNSVSADAKHHTLLYALPTGVTRVSLQLLPPGRERTAHVANVVLTVRVNGEPRDAILLAAAGNVETIRITPAVTVQTSTLATPGTDQCGLRRRRWFASRSGDRSVRSIATVEDWGVHIELLVPTPVIETWVPIARANRDFLEPAERRRAIANVETFIVDRFDVRVNGSNPLVPIVTATFLDVADPRAATDRQTDRLSAWTTRLRFSLRFRSAERPDRVEVDWKLFNAIVLTSTALAVTPGECHEFDFSTYNPHWSWQR